jgi:1,4-dihydroxy-6-naphthoate synthase
MRITVAHSPDSDDAFMHYGLASGKVPHEGIEFHHLLADIETLNRAAFEGKYEVSAVSFHAYAHLTDKYLLLPHGSSMGDNYGPIVVARSEASSAPLRETQGRPEQGRGALEGVRVAIPGTLTTAFLALRLYKPDVAYDVMPFDQIQDAVRDGRAEAGLLIHEGQLTYGDDGLRKIVDLGEWWSQQTQGLPLPLGGNVIRRDLGPAMVAKVSRILHASIAYALSHRDEALDYALTFGRGLDRGKADRFVGMYVNELTLDYGERGKRAVQLLLDEAAAKGVLPRRVAAEYA